MITDGNDASPMDDYKGWVINKQMEPQLADAIARQQGKNLDGSIRRETVAVTHPTHYARWKMEPIEFIAINNLPWWLANLIKYAMRYDAKDGIKDLYKGRSYLDMKIREVEGHIRFWDAPVAEERALNSGVVPLPSEAHYVSVTEGHLWEPFVPHRFDTVHAIQFTDDRIWDARNGWRTDNSTRLRRDHEEPLGASYAPNPSGNRMAQCIEVRRP
jgi:hypothetical protein